MFITKKSANSVNEEQVENALAILREYTDIYIVGNILREIDLGEDGKLIEFLNDLEISQYNNYNRTRINSADIVLRKIKNDIENEINGGMQYTVDDVETIRNVVNDGSVKREFNKYIKNEITFLIFKYFENKTNKMLEELQNVEDNKEEFERLYEEHKKLFLVIANVCLSYRECTYEEKGQFIHKLLGDSNDFVVIHDNGLHTPTCENVRRTAINNYFNADNSLVRILKKPRNYFLSGVAVCGGNYKFNQLCKRLNNAFTLKKLEFDLQDENKINTKDLLQLYNKNIRRKNGKDRIFDISERNVAKFLKKHVGHYGFKWNYECDCAEDFTYTFGIAVNNRRDNIVKNISNSINNYQNNQLGELKEKIQKLMKKTTLLNTKVKIFTELYLHGKEDVSKQDVKNIKKDIKELIKNKKTKNFSNLLSAVQKELNIRILTRDGIISF